MVAGIGHYVAKGEGLRIDSLLPAKG